MGATSSKTGTQKKFAKKELKNVGKLQEEAVKDVFRLRPFTREARRRTEDIAKGKHGVRSGVGELSEALEKSTKKAGKLLEPIRKATESQAVSNYQKYLQPTIASTFQGGGTARSSAMQQASANALADLQYKLGSDFARMQTELGQNILNSSQQGKLTNLNARLQANAPFTGAQVPNPITGLGASNPYMQSGNRGPNSTQALIGTGLEAGLTALGTAYGGPAGGAGANQGAKFINNKLGLTAQDESIFGRG